MLRKVHAAGIIFEDEGGSVLVLRRHQNSPEGNTWGLVGGNIDEGENSSTAALREAKEEINHEIPPSELKYIKTYQWERPDLKLTFDVFKYKVVRKNMHLELDTEENMEHMWELPKVLRQRQDLMIGLYPILVDEYV